MPKANPQALKIAKELRKRFPQEESFTAELRNDVWPFIQQAEQAYRNAEHSTSGPYATTA